jgi:hypothetical protein
MDSTYVRDWPEKITRFLSRETSSSFEQLALELFYWQAQHLSIYSSYLQLIGRDPKDIKCIGDIPFLPISFFKTHHIYSGESAPEMVFTSSSTGQQGVSKHPVHDLSWYHKVSLDTFEKIYGKLEQYYIFALLPSYLERQGSSLVEMIRYFLDNGAIGGFYLHEQDALLDAIQAAMLDQSRKTILWGVSFALLDFMDGQKLDMPDLIIMETGGMKGRKREITREELHTDLREKFNVSRIHGEYGMTELMSQAYDAGEGKYTTGPLMRVYPRSIYDPLSPGFHGRQAALNIIDLGNIYSCAFIATDDLAIVHDSKHFNVMGRLDASDIRGCNLMVGNT